VKVERLAVEGPALRFGLRAPSGFTPRYISETKLRPCVRVAATEGAKWLDKKPCWPTDPNVRRASERT